MTEHTADLRREEIARIADEADRHWLDRTDTGVGCSCGDWFFALSDAHPQIDVGDHFLPFSKHVATALHDAILRSQDTATARIALDVTILRDALHALEPHRSVSAQSIEDNAIKAEKVAAEYDRLGRAVLSGETRTGGEPVE
jgi:hypothetical protein